MKQYSNFDDEADRHARTTIEPAMTFSGIGARAHYAIAGILLAAICIAPTQAANFLQFGYDEAHSGNNTAERGYSTATGNRLLYANGLSLPYAPYISIQSTPVYLANVVTGSGTKSLLFVVASDGRLLAIDAADGSIVWSQLASGNSPQVRASPAIDPALAFVYSHGADGKIHKYQVADGLEITDDFWPEVVTLKPNVEKGASGLTIASVGDKSFLYSVTSGYYYDGGDYQGHLTTIDLSTGSQSVFNAMCSNLAFHLVENGSSSNDCIVGSGYGVRGGIWGPAGAVFDNKTQRVYFATGNGVFDANTPGGREWGDSVLALNPDGSGIGMGLPLDSYTPATFSDLDIYDQDLGSSSPAILPAPAGSKYAHLALQTGKDACVRLLNLDDLSGHSGPAHVGGEVNADACTEAAVGSGFAQPAVWINPSDKSTWVFVSGERLTAFKLTTDPDGTPKLLQKWQKQEPGSSPFIANNQLYRLSFYSPVRLSVLDPLTGNVILESSPAYDYVIFESPIVVDGHIYMTIGGTVVAYALDGIFRGTLEK